MANYRNIFTDLRTGTRIAELNVRNLRYGSRLNRAGAASGEISYPSITSTGGAQLAALINDAVDECRREWIIERDGVVVWSGPIWASPYQSSPTVRSLAAMEDWSYYWHRVVDWKYDARQIDQLVIARNLLQAAAASTGGDIGVTVGTETSGVLRDRTYNPFELKPVAEAIEQLAAVDRGFDFAIDSSWDPTTGALIKKFNLHYPRRGRSYKQTGHVFEVGRNVTAWNWPSDGTRAANKVWASGRGEGDSMLISSATDNWQIQPLTSGGPGYPLLETTISNGDVSVQSTLDSQSLARLKAVARPVVLPKVKVRADRDPVFGTFITGDSCRFIVPPGTDPRFPSGLDTFLRIIAWDVSVDDQGNEEVDLTLGEEPGA